MPISSEVRKAGPFAGNDVTTVFPFTFKVFQTSEVLVISADALEVETELVENTDYTVSLNANQNSNPGGSVTLATALATGHVLVITSDVQSLQPMDLTNQGGFYPAVINDAMDRLTILVQQQAEQLSRSAKLPITRTEDVDSLLADIVLMADNLTTLNTLVSNLANINAVAAIDANVTTVAGIAANVTTVAGVSADVTLVAAVDAEVAALAAITASITALAAVAASIPTVAAESVNVGLVGTNIADVTAVAAALSDIAAAVADLPSLAAKVSKTGDTMTGHLNLIAGASGSQAPRASEIGVLADAQLTTHYKRANILGSVSQSSGVPTGAVIEQGSSALGAYTRWADGTQICWHTIDLGSTTAVGAGTYADPYRTAASAWMYPAAFISAPVIQGVGASNGTASFNRSLVLSFETVSTTQVTTISLVKITSSAISNTGVVHLAAIGRWF